MLHIHNVLINVDEMYYSAGANFYYFLDSMSAIF